MVTDGIDVFVKVVQAGSFGGAARALNMPLATVSAKVARLEERLGVTLIQRSTRKMHVTEAGSAYFLHCAEAIRSLEAGERQLLERNGEPNGTLRISASTDGAQLILPALIERYLGTSPGVSVDVIVSNAHVDLLTLGVDLALRAGPLKDSGLQSRKFGPASFGLFASPEYLAAHGTPTSPAELGGHDIMAHTRAPDALLQMSSPEGAFDLQVQGRVQADDMQTLRVLAEHHLGIVLLPVMITEVRGGQLTRVLSDYQAHGNDLYFVYPGGKFTAPNVRAFIDMSISLQRTVT